MKNQRNSSLSNKCSTHDPHVFQYSCTRELSRCLGQLSTDIKFALSPSWQFYNAGWQCRQHFYEKLFFYSCHVAIVCFIICDISSKIKEGGCYSRRWKKPIPNIHSLKFAIPTSRKRSYRLSLKDKYLAVLC